MVCISDSNSIGSRELSPAVSEGESGGRPINEQNPAKAGFALSFVINCHQNVFTEKWRRRELHPRPEIRRWRRLRVYPSPLIVGLKAPIGRVLFSVSCHEINPSRNRWLDSSEPALSSPGEASGRRLAAEPFLLLRQPYGERESSRQLSFGRLFTRPADQPRHATSHLGNPVDPGSPPNCQRHIHLSGRAFSTIIQNTPSRSRGFTQISQHGVPLSILACPASLLESTLDFVRCQLS